MSEGEGASPPLIVTVLLPRDLHSRFTALRTAHFPPERNYLKAHVTLFHAIPPQCEEEVCDLLKRLVSEEPPPSGRVEGIMSLGRGTAIKLTSPEILSIRDDIADHFHGMLTAQDQHRPRLHVTVQNKVTSAEAKALQAELEPEIQPQGFRSRGLALYRYMGGPWEPIREFAFRG